MPLPLALLPQALAAVRALAVEAGCAVQVYVPADSAPGTSLTLIGPRAFEIVRAISAAAGVPVAETRWGRMSVDPRREYRSASAQLPGLLLGAAESRSADVEAA